ncbi:non-ribosomal peptide synthetase, partial [Bacillus gaemokensis]
DLNGSKAESTGVEFTAAKFDLTFSIYEVENTYKMVLEYCTDLYKQESAERLLTHLINIMNQVVSNPTIKLNEIDVITKEERALVTKGFNDTYSAYPKEKTVVELFEEQVEKTPNHIAVTFEDEEITYRELNQKANTLAHKLRSLGVKSDDYVAIMAERSIEMIVGIYGIIKAGGAYVPVDPIYPKDRIDYMLADCTPKAALTYKAEIETEIPVIDLTDNSIFIGEAENPVRVNQSSDLLYVIYTSGTTGQPKGVMIEHKGVANTLQWRQQEYALKERDTVLQLFSFAFDGFVTSMFTPLLSGANVVIQSEEKARDILAIKQDITRYRVTHMIIVPVLYRELLNVLQPEDVRTLRIVTLAGEAVDQELIEQSLIKCPGTELTNEYGPTENSIATTIMRNLERQKNVSIGRPIDNAQVYILDGDNLQPIGVVGELCIAGRGIARGYLNRPELTEEKFIDNPFGEGKLYRSGDLARWLPDGNIEYLGRIDEQIKIRGFRIELGEIENVIRRAEGVTDAALIVREDKNGEKAICAYVTAENKLSISDLREEISKELPAYMIPAYIMQIDKIPVTRNGKLDKRALPEIEVKGEKEYITPRSETEEVLSEIFSEVLGVKKISIKDSFFELGGDSIKAIRIVSKMREAGYDLSVKEIMSKHTVEAIAYVAIAAAENNYEQHEVIGTVVATPILKTFEAWNLTKPSHFNQAMMVPVDVREETLKKVLEALVIHHDMLRAVYRNGTLEILNSRESKLYDFSVYDFNGEQNMKEKVEAECTRLQGSIDLESGPLLKTALFKTDVGKYLIICLHHLVVDGVSWRILLEDFTTAMKQVEAGEEIVLPKKTASYKAWSELLKEYKNSKNLIQEKGYWETVAEEMKSGRVEWDTDCTGTGYGNIGIFFDERETKKLLYEAGKAFNTEINDLLLSALGMAIRKLKGQTKVSIGLEGHGREEIHEPIEIDRTVGWFTSMYPVVVECKDDISESIIATKEMLRNVPNHGIGYGLLMEEDHGAKPDLYFNYLGELNSYTENESSRNITTFSTGLSIAEENRLPGTINFNGSIAQSKLCFVVTYDAKRYLEETINKLGVLYKEILIEIVEYCSNQKESTKTASDYSTNDLETSDLAVLRTRFSDIEDIYSLTALQEGMLFHNVMDRESTSYIVQSVYTLHGEVDNEKVGQALKFLARKHGVLRSAIAQQNISKPRQLVLENKKVEYEEINLTQLSESQQEKKISEVISLDVKRGFNLETDSLLRVKYIKLKNESHKLIWSFHHIIMDGWCISLVFGDFLRYYEQLKNDVSIEDIEHMIEKEKEKTAGYNEYAKWLEGQDKEKGLEYWTELLSEYEEPAEIRPMKKPALTDEQMGRIRVSLEKEISQRLNEMALSNNVTLNTVMEAAWGVVLQKYNGNDDVVFGKVVSGRTAKIKGIEEIVGLFVNTIPVRVKREADMTVVELLRVLQKQGIEGSSYDYCSLPEVQNQTKLGSALIKTLFAFENYYVDRERLKSSKNGLQIEMESTREQTNYTLNITAHFDGEKLYYDIMYNPNVYEKSEIQSILTRIKAVLQDMSLNPQKKLIEIETTTEEEKTLIVGEFNNTSSEYPREKTVAGLFEEQVEKTPNHIAVTFEDEEITYRELNQRANALAHKLRSLGVKPDDYVAIMAERSVEMIVGIYGIIKAGGAYVPMDPTYPKDRIEYMLEDCTPKAVLTYKAEIETEIPVIDLAEHSVFIGEEENPVQVNQSSDLLYVIYTSGTTGKPKGVMVENRGVIAMREYLMELYQITEKDNILQFANYIFDASVWEMTISLLTGATLKIASSEEISDVNVFNEFVSDSEITITLLSPQYYMQAKPEGLRILTTGGSASNAEIIKKASSDCRYINAYGPTENTVLATHWEYKNDDEFTDLIPIGKPISNTHIYILNEKNLCGIGIPGELCIAGDG